MLKSVLKRRYNTIKILIQKHSRRGNSLRLKRITAMIQKAGVFRSIPASFSCAESQLISVAPHLLSHMKRHAYALALSTEVNGKSYAAWRSSVYAQDFSCPRQNCWIGFYVEKRLYAVYYKHRMNRRRFLFSRHKQLWNSLLRQGKTPIAQVIEKYFEKIIKNYEFMKKKWQYYSDL